MIDIKPAIKNMTDADRRLVKRLYYALFPNAAEYRYRNVLLHGNNEFSAIERNALAKYLIEVNGKILLDSSDEFLTLIGEPIVTAPTFQL